MPRRKHPQGFLSTQETADFFNVDKSTVIRWVHQRKLRPTQANAPGPRGRLGTMWFDPEYLAQKREEWTQVPEPTPEPEE